MADDTGGSTLLSCEISSLGRELKKVFLSSNQQDDTTPTC